MIVLLIDRAVRGQEFQRFYNVFFLFFFFFLGPTCALIFLLEHMCTICVLLRLRPEEYYDLVRRVYSNGRRRRCPVGVASMRMKHEFETFTGTAFFVLFLNMEVS